MKQCCSGAVGLYTSNAHDIIFDHVSVSWGADETVDAESASNVTWQWGIISEPLLNGGPGKHDRARNMLLTKSGNISIHHNLFAMGRFRNPQIKPAYDGAVSDVVNNVLYSPEWVYVSSFGDEWSKVQANIVGNYKIAGAEVSSDRLVHLFKESGRGFSIYAADNVDETYMPDAAEDQAEAVSPIDRTFLAAERFAAPPVSTTTAREAYEDVLIYAGAVRPYRDQADRRVVQAVLSRTGAILPNDPADVGGWPVLKAGAPYPDMDRDGVSDEWEAANGMNLNNAADGAQDADGDGWTNLEEFLHVLAGDVPAN